MLYTNWPGTINDVLKLGLCHMTDDRMTDCHLVIVGTLELPLRLHWSDVKCMRTIESYTIFRTTHNTSACFKA